MADLLDSYPETNQSATDDAYGNPPKGAGQAITLSIGSSYILDSMKWYLRKIGSPTGSGYAKIYSVTGTPGTNGVPNVLLATSDAFDVSTLTTSFALITFTFSGANRITLTNGENIAMSFEYTGGNGSNLVNIGSDNTSPTHAGNEFYDSGSWNADNTYDECFYLYGVSAALVNQNFSLLGIGS